MSLFRRPEREGTQRFSWPEYLKIIAGNASGPDGAQEIGVALRHPTVYRCVDLVAGTFSTLPVDVYAPGTRTPLTKTPNVVANPSVSLNPIAWRHAAVASLMLRGNLYGLAFGPRAPLGQADGAELVHPDSVTWSEKDGFKVGGKSYGVWPNGPLWHVPAFVLPGCPVGLSPIEYARRTIYGGLAPEEFAAQFFRDGGHPTTVISPERDPGEAGSIALKERYVEATRGNREPIVIPQSVKLQQLQVSPSDSQFLEAQRFSAEQVARFMGVAPEMVGVASSGSSVTYANREQRMQDFLQFTMTTWLVRMERGIEALLGTGATIKHNVNALMRPDQAGRYAGYKTAAEIAQITGETFQPVSEMRALEDWAPLDPDAASRGGAQTDELVKKIQQIYLGVGVVVTVEEARQILNRYGADLPADLPAGLPEGLGQPAVAPPPAPAA